MLKIDKKERERILRLHESKNSKNLLSEQVTTTGFDYSTAQFRGATPGNERWYKLYKEFCDAVYGLGTNEDELLAVIRKIANWQEFQFLNTLLQQSHNYNSNNYKDFAQVIQQELGKDDCGVFDAIKEHLNKLGIPNYSEAYDTTTEKCRPDLFRIGRKPGSEKTNTGGTTTNTGGSSSGNLTKQIQKTLGIPETGKMDQETINKAYDAVSKR